jgi:molecular chaperone GrpE
VTFSLNLPAIGKKFMKKEKKTEISSREKELESQLKRALADYDNLKKRQEEEKHAVVKFANAVLMVKFLEVLDALETAQKNLNDAGLELVIKKFRDLLASENIKEIGGVGQDFDPNLHEAISVVEGEQDNKVLEVLQKGYHLDGKILRPAHVMVTKNAEKVEKS